MDVEIVKTSSATDGSMDMMTMMMQMEKFPEEFCEPFYNTPTTYQEMDHGTSLFNVNPNQNMSQSQPTLIDSHSLSLPSNVSFIQQQPLTQTNTSIHHYPSSSEKKNSMAAMREMIFRIAVMQPVHIDPEAVKPPKRRNVKISKDPQSVAARHRRERISERIRILQRLVPGGTKMDTASMLDEAIHYVKFLKKQVQTLEQVGANRNTAAAGGGGGGGNFTGLSSNFNVNYSSLFVKGCQPYQMVGSTSKQLLS